MDTERKSILVLSKAARILDYVTGLEAPESMTRMSAALGIPRATLYRLLDALEEEGLLAQDRNGYRIGPRLLGWAVEALNNSDLRAPARPYMEQLREQFGLSVSLYIRGPDSRICLERLEGRGLLRPAVRIGEHLPLHLCASGTALVAWLPEGERDRALTASRQRFADSQVIDREPGWWASIRRQGWVLTIGERDTELAGIAVPVFDREQHPVASLVVSGSRYQFTEAGLEIGRLADQLLGAARQVQALLGQPTGRT